MSKQNVEILTGVVSSNPEEQKEITIHDLAPNNYLTIIWRDAKTGKVYNTMDIANDEAIEYTNAINSAIDVGINNNNIKYVGQNRFINIESISRYIAQNKIKDSTRRRVASAIIGLINGNPSSLSNNVINLLLNVFGEIADKTARDLGYTDPQEVFSQIAGQNVITVLKQLGERTQEFIDNFMKRSNEKSENDISTKSNDNKVKRYAGIILGLTTNDTESYEVTIPKKKVEVGSDYTTHLLPQSFKKDFTVHLTNKVISPNFTRIEEINNIEAVKDKLIEIANSHTLFDIYIRLSSEKIYKKTNVSFTSLSFTKDESSGNGYMCTFSISPVNSFASKVFVSDKVFRLHSNDGGKKSTSKSDATTGGQPLTIGFIGDKTTEQKMHFKNVEELIQHAKDSNRYLFYSKNITPNYKVVELDFIAEIYQGDNIPLENRIFAIKEDTQYIANGKGKRKLIRGRASLVKNIFSPFTMSSTGTAIKRGDVEYIIYAPFDKDMNKNK